MLTQQAAACTPTPVQHLGVITLDNHCTNDCSYCPYARSNRKIIRFSLSPQRLLADAAALARARYDWLVLQMGQAPSSRMLQWRDAFATIRARHPSLRLMVGAGEQTEGAMRALASAGVDAYWICLECSDNTLFQTLRPVGLLARRRFTIRTAILGGLRVATGLTVGLPDETEDQLAESVAEITELAPDIVCVNIFHPCRNSRTATAPPPDRALVSRAVASLRLALPDRLIFTGCPVPAPGPFDPEASITAGASGIMVNVDSLPVFPRLTRTMPSALRETLDHA